MENVVGRVSSVLIKKIDMLDTPLCDTPSIVAPLVESDNAGYPQLVKNRHVVLGKESAFTRFYLPPTASEIGHEQRSGHLLNSSLKGRSCGAHENWGEVKESLRTLIQLVSAAVKRVVAHLVAIPYADGVSSHV